MNNLILGI